MKDLQAIQSRYRSLMGANSLPPTAINAAMRQAGALSRPNSERGMRSTPENSIRYLYNLMWVDPELRASILDIREMDRLDSRVKRIHGRTSRAATKGGLKLNTSSDNKRLIRAWDQFRRRLQLHRPDKLESDMRGLMMEGNLPIQWVLDQDGRVSAGIRMPSETIRPVVGQNGAFVDPQKAYEQFDLMSGKVIAVFPLWALSLVRLTPDNYDDHGCMGRPYLDAARPVWKKLTMTEEDLVIRRRERAPLRTAHFLEGATPEYMEEYQSKIEDDQKEITTNYYSNTKGSVQSVQGDANLDQIADVEYLLDTFFSGAPAPKGLFGYVGNLARDVLEDLKQDFFDELDAMQDTAAMVYELGFRLDLLLQGINPDNYEFEVRFAERRTETPNQAADRALKLQAMGASQQTVWTTAGLNPTLELKQRGAEKKSSDPYPGYDDGASNPVDGTQRVSITPGNGPNKESATYITNGNKDNGSAASPAEKQEPESDNEKADEENQDKVKQPKSKQASEGNIYEYHFKYKLVTRDEARKKIGLRPLKDIGKDGGDDFPEVYPEAQPKP